MAFSGAADEVGGSGLDGYSVVFDQNPATEPDAAVEIPHTVDPHLATSAPLADGSDWYFHLSTCDLTGNCTDTVHAGPFWIDTTAPGAPLGLTSMSHVSGVPSTVDVVDVVWQPSVDGGSGVAGYSWWFSPTAVESCEMTLDGDASTLAASSASLTDGAWWAHVCAVDEVGNWSAVSIAGPFVVDSTESVPLVFFTEYDAPDLGRGSSIAPLDPVLVLAGPEIQSPIGMVADFESGYLFWVEYWTGRLRRSNLDGTNPQDLLLDLVNPHDLELDRDAGKLYWSERGSGKIRRADLDGSNAEDVMTLTAPFGLALDPSSEQIYVALLFDGKIQRVGYDGSGPLDVLTGLADVTGVAVDPPAGKIYWSEYRSPTGAIRRANLDGTDIEDLATDLAYPNDLVLDTGPGFLYWAEQWASRIARVPVAGGAAETVLNTWGGPENVTLVRFDSTPPSGPTSIESTSHPSGGWASDPQIAMTWSGASDGSSGVAGYSVLFDGIADTEADTSIDVPHAMDPHGVSSGPLSEGTWYFHLSTCDLTANCTPSAHRGPYGIDTSQPGEPGEIVSSSHGVGLPSSDTTVDVTWGAATDSLSGIDGYSYFFDGSPVSPCETSKDVEEGTLAASSAVLADGSWFAHVCAVDNAGNWGLPVHGGPYVVDTTAPTGLMASSTSHAVSDWSNDSTVDFAFSGAADANGIAGYAVAFDEGAATEPSCAVTQAGSTYEGNAAPDGVDWWLHVRAVDPAGNCGATVHLGPFWIDSTPPLAVAEVSSASHGDGLPKRDGTIEVAWPAAADGLSGIASYRYEFLEWATPPPACAALAESTLPPSATSAPLQDGSWYLAVCALDVAGNEGPLAFGAPYVVNLEGTATTVFWANWLLQAVGVAQADGTGLGSVSRSLGPLMIEVDLAGGHVYWTEYGGDGIFRSDLDHGNEVSLGSGLSAAHGLAVDQAAGHLYFTQRGSGTVSRMNLDGSGVVDLVTGLASPHDLELDVEAGKMYWADEFGGVVQRANLDGSGVETLASGQGGPTGVALDLRHGRLFWTERSTGRVDRSALDGSGAVSLISGLSEPLDIDYVEADGKIYFTEVGPEGWLRRASGDGTGVENLVPFGGSPEGIAVRLFFADDEAPASPASLEALAPHVEGGWTDSSTLTMEWSGAADEVDGSGLSGYSNRLRPGARNRVRRCYRRLPRERSSRTGCGACRGSLVLPSQNLRLRRQLQPGHPPRPLWSRSDGAVGRGKSRKHEPHCGRSERGRYGGCRVVGGGGSSVRSRRVRLELQRLTGLGLRPSHGWRRREPLDHEQSLEPRELVVPRLCRRCGGQLGPSGGCRPVHDRHNRPTSARDRICRGDRRQRGLRG